MSRKKLYQIIYKKPWFKVAYILVIIIIVVLVVILDKHQKAKKEEVNKTIATAQTKLLELGVHSVGPLPGRTLGDSDLPDTSVMMYAGVYNWRGKITKIEDSKIVFRSPYENSMTPGDDYMDVTAHLGPDTKFFLLDLSKPLNDNEMIEQRLKEIEKSKLKNGQQIIAESENDLSLGLEIVPKTIYLIET